MDFGLANPETLEQAQYASSEFNSRFLLFGVLGLILLVGRPLFVVIMSGKGFRNPFRDWTGAGMIFAGIAMMSAGLWATGNLNKSWIQFKRNITDPIIVDYLKRDSCDPVVERFCVVVFEEDGREIVVNWFDKRVNMFKLVNGHLDILTTSARPRLRPDGLVSDTDVARLGVGGD